MRLRFGIKNNGPSESFKLFSQNDRDWWVSTGNTVNGTFILSRQIGYDYSSGYITRGEDYI